jgi:anti-sigma B factor antagonist
MGRAFGVESGSIGAALLITVCGEVDILTVPEVVDHLNAAIVSSAKRVVVDCSDVRFMDSKMVEALYRATSKLQANDGAIAVACGDSYVRRVFEVLGLDALIPVRETPVEALASLN